MFAAGFFMDYLSYEMSAWVMSGALCVSVGINVWLKLSGVWAKMRKGNEHSVLQNVYVSLN